MPLVRTSPCAVLAVCPCGSIACHHAPIWPLGAHIQTARHGLQLPVRRLRPFAWASPPTPLRNIRSLLNCSVDFPCSSLDLSICLQRCPADCRRAAAPPPRHAAPPNRAWQAAPACRLEPQPLPRATTSEPTSRPAQPPTVHVGPLICCAVLSAPGPPASTRGALAQLLLRRPLCLDIASDSSLRNICIHLLQPARRARSSTPPSTLPVLLFSRSASRGSTGAPH